MQQWCFGGKSGHGRVLLRSWRQRKLRNAETWSSDGWTGEELKDEELKDEELKDEELKEEELKDEDHRVGVAIPSTRLARSKDAVATEHSIVGLRCGRNELV